MHTCITHTLPAYPRAPSSHRVRQSYPEDCWEKMGRNGDKKSVCCCVKIFFLRKIHRGGGRGTPFGPKDFCTHNCAETFHLRFFPFFTRRHLGMADVVCEKEMPGSAWEVCKLCSVCIFRKTPKGHRRTTEGPPAKKSKMHPENERTNRT